MIRWYIVLVEAGRLFRADQVSEAEKGKLDLPDLNINHIFLTANKEKIQQVNYLRSFVLYWCNKYRNCGTTETLQSALRSLIINGKIWLSFRRTQGADVILFSVVFTPSPPSHFGRVWVLPAISLHRAGFLNHMMGKVSWDPKGRRSWAS